MSDSLNHHEVRKYLSAFADGELEVEQNLKVLEQLALDPATSGRVIHQQQLRKAVARCLADPCECPDAVKARLIAMLDAEAVGGAAAAPPALAPAAVDRAVLGRVGRWAPLAVAAALTLGTMVLLMEGGRAGVASPTGRPFDRVAAGGGGVSGGGYAIVPAGSDLLPPERLAAFSQRHVRCANGLSKLYRTAEFPREVQTLPASVAEHIGHRVNHALDLAAVGYRYQLAGVCSLPGVGSVHILYEATPESGRSDRLSLWVRPIDRHSPALEPGRVYVAADTNQPHPMLLWRDDDLIYYLMGDAGDRVQVAAATLRRDGR